MKILLNDDLLRAILLDWISRTATPERGSDHLSRDPVVRGLSMLSLGEVRTLAMTAQDAVSVTIDRDALTSAIDVITKTKTRSSQLEFFVQNGATREMLVEVLGVSENRIDAVRKKLGRPAVGRGRPRMPDILTRARIVDRWHELSSLEIVERYIALRSEFTDWTLGTLLAVVNELSAGEASERPAPKFAALTGIQDGTEERGV